MRNRRSDLYGWLTLSTPTAYPEAAQSQVVAAAAKPEPILAEALTTEPMPPSLRAERLREEEPGQSLPVEVTNPAKSASSVVLVRRQSP